MSDPERLPKQVARIIRGLLEERTLDQLADHVGIHSKTLSRYLRALRKGGEQLVRICDWEENAQGRRVVPVYQFNPLVPDVKRPKRMSSAARMRRYRQKKKRVASVFDLATGGTKICD